MQEILRLARGPLLDADDHVEAVGVEHLAPGDLEVIAAVLDVLLQPLFDCHEKSQQAAP